MTTTDQPTEISLPIEQVRALNETYSGKSIADDGKLRGITTVRGMTVAVTGGLSSMQEGLLQVCATQVIHLSAYQGELEPKLYSAHWDAVDAGDRERCYAGMRVKYKNEWYVFHGKEIIITAETKEDAQQSLF